MREIKFRAFDNRTKQIGEIAYINFKSQSCGFYGLTSHSGIKIFNRDLADVKLIQYTGLKDKNGVEIYESDVCKVIYTDGWELGIVEYEKGTFYVIDNSLGMNYDRIEVIGNIYENPELLEIEL